MILNKKTLRKRRRREFYNKIIDWIKSRITKRRAKKLTEQLRKHYVHTGETQCYIEQANYKYDLHSIVEYLSYNGGITYSTLDDTKSNIIYEIYIPEPQISQKVPLISQFREHIQRIYQKRVNTRKNSTKTRNKCKNKGDK